MTRRPPGPARRAPGWADAGGPTSSELEHDPEACRGGGGGWEAPSTPTSCDALCKQTEEAGNLISARRSAAEGWKRSGTGLTAGLGPGTAGRRTGLRGQEDRIPVEETPALADLPIEPTGGRGTGEGTDHRPPPAIVVGVIL